MEYGNKLNFILLQDNDDILEAYVKSWTSGALDRAANRGSVAYTMALHHLSSFIFRPCDGDKLLLRNRLVKSLLQDLSLKQHHEVIQVCSESCLPVL